jgi:hypothetical protein
MLSKLRLVTILALTIGVFTPAAFGAPTKIGMITLYESSFEYFGALHFPFLFKISAPLEYVLCENGVSSNGGCVNNDISDVVCLTNNSAGEAVTAMISDDETPLSLGNLPPDFPCQQTSSPPPTVTFLQETGKSQTLTPKGGLPTTLPSGAAGPPITVIAMSDVNETQSESDFLLVETP